MRFPLAYVAAWLPVLAAYVLLFSAMQDMSVGLALVSGVLTVVPGAILGVPVWHSVRRGGARRSGGQRAFLRHALQAAAYALAWAAAILGEMALTAPRAALDAFIEAGLAWQVAIGLAGYALLAGFAAKGRAEQTAVENEAVAARAETARVTAELRSLRARLDPHFLFNTLHSITTLVHQDPRATEEALNHFAAMLRYVLDVDRQNRDQVTLEEELSFVHSYLALERLRLGDRLRIEAAISDDALECLIPPLTVQPLVENAIRHGLAPMARGGTLTMRASVDHGDLLHLEVGDDGAGAASSAGLLDGDALGGHPGRGLGLPLVRARLAMRYPTLAFDITTAPGSGFRVSVTLPAVTRGDL